MNGECSVIPVCTSTSDCPSGQVCTNSVCGACSADAECGTGKTCSSGACIPKRCSSNAQCAGGAVCKNAACGACSADVDCGQGKSCAKGTCVAGTTCNSKADCPTGQACVNGACGPCGADSDCGTGSVCKDTLCITKCKVASDCPTGQVCGASGTCAACKTGVPCTDAACLGNAACLMADRECQGMIAGDVCRPAAGSCQKDAVCALSGNNLKCPANELLKSGASCSPTVAGECVKGGQCSGQDADCKTIHWGNERRCGQTTGDCVLPQHCDGASDTCPLADIKWEDWRDMSDPSNPCKSLPYCDGRNPNRQPAQPFDAHKSCTSVAASDCYETPHCNGSGTCVQGAQRPDRTRCGSDQAEECVGGSCVDIMVDLWVYFDMRTINVFPPESECDSSCVSPFLDENNLQNTDIQFELINAEYPNPPGDPIWTWSNYKDRYSHTVISCGYRTGPFNVTPSGFPLRVLANGKPRLRIFYQDRYPWTSNFVARLDRHTGDDSRQGEQLGFSDKSIVGEKGLEYCDGKCRSYSNFASFVFNSEWWLGCAPSLHPENKGYFYNDLVLRPW